MSRWRPGGGVASDVKNINLAFAGVGDRLEFFETLELALVGPVVVEGFAINNFHRAQRAESAASQPYFPITPHANQPKQLVIGNDGWGLSVSGWAGEWVSGKACGLRRGPGRRRFRIRPARWSEFRG